MKMNVLTIIIEREMKEGWDYEEEFYDDYDYYENE
jgi:hypothetical protein